MLVGQEAAPVAADLGGFGRGEVRLAGRRRCRTSPWNGRPAS